MLPPVLRLILDGPQSHATNMAVDEALLSQALQPVLRAYEWDQKCVSIGYFSKKAQVPPGVDFVRRSSGGGIVSHGDDFTFSVVFPVAHDFARTSAEEAYEGIHDCLRCALEEVGVKCVLADCCVKGGTGECFVGYEKYDVLAGGVKIAGGAQKRTSKGFLHQGSVHFAGERRSLALALSKQIARRFSLEIRDSSLTPAEKSMVQDLEKSRYANPAWNDKF